MVHITDARLLTLLRANGTGSPVVAKGKRLFAKVNCPAAVGRAWRIAAQGLLNRRQPATTRRTVKVAVGKSKQIALQGDRRPQPQADPALAPRQARLDNGALS